MALNLREKRNEGVDIYSHHIRNVVALIMILRFFIKRSPNGIPGHINLSVWRL